MERIKKALSVFALLLVASAVPAQVGAMVSGSNAYEDNCGNRGSVTVTAGPSIGGVRVYYVLLHYTDVNGVPYIIEQTMIAGNPLAGQGTWLIRMAGDNNGWFDYIGADGNPTNGLTHPTSSPSGGTGSAYRGPQP